MSELILGTEEVTGVYLSTRQGQAGDQLLVSGTGAGAEHRVAAWSAPEHMVSGHTGGHILTTLRSTDHPRSQQ